MKVQVKRQKGLGQLVFNYAGTTPQRALDLAVETCREREVTGIDYFEVYDHLTDAPVLVADYLGRPAITHTEAAA
jgi:hypothetical protein